MFFKGVVYKGRSIWKGLNLYVFSKTYFYDNNRILKKFYVLGEFDVGMSYKIYNGKLFIAAPLSYKTYGCKFGQFILTKKIGSGVHLDKEKKKKKSNG